jgi:hypothetical protein
MMTENEYLFTGLEVVAKQVKDHSMETGPDGTPVRQELPGKIFFGVLVDGVFVPFLERKAPGLLADIERAKSSSTAAG